MARVLIIDDEEKLRTLMARIIRLEGFETVEAGNIKTALRKLETEHIDVVLCDVKLPDGNGVEFTTELRQKYPTAEVILLTAYGNIPDGVQAIKNGAFDYITKGDDNNKIVPLLHRAMEKTALAKRISQLEQQLGKRYSFDSIIGTSPAITDAVVLAKKVAATDATVLLTGETGTGKEVFAQAIHQSGARKNKNFVAVNCAAFSKELIESELFGYKAGAFTGATRDKKGLMKEADEGTLFLDEIGEMPNELQAKLLRVIETGEFLPVGDSRTVRVNVRIIAATHRNLSEEIKAGHFREDLYYRLSVFQIHLPALRERIVDIEPLAKNFMSVFAAKTNKPTPQADDEFFRLLSLYPFPGNIRELKNIIERCVILAAGNYITIDLLPPEIQHSSDHTGKPISAFDLASAEKVHIQKVMNYTHGNKTEAARLLNIAITTLYRKLEEYNIR